MKNLGNRKNTLRQRQRRRRRRGGGGQTALLLRGAGKGLSAPPSRESWAGLRCCKHRQAFDYADYAISSRAFSTTLWLDLAIRHPFLFNSAFYPFPPSLSHVPLEHLQTLLTSESAARSAHLNAAGSEPETGQQPSALRLMRKGCEGHCLSCLAQRRASSAAAYTCSPASPVRVRIQRRLCLQCTACSDSEPAGVTGPGRPQPYLLVFTVWALGIIRPLGYVHGAIGQAAGHFDHILEAGANDFAAGLGVALLLVNGTVLLDADVVVLGMACSRECNGLRVELVLA
jgi:hypothetical protein